MCGEAVARLVARRTGRPLDPYADLLGGAARPVAVPVPLGVLARDDDEGNPRDAHRPDDRPDRPDHGTFGGTA
jgi:hypothetical protein